MAKANHSFSSIRSLSSTSFEKENDFRCHRQSRFNYKLAIHSIESRILPSLP